MRNKYYSVRFLVSAVNGTMSEAAVGGRIKPPGAVTGFDSLYLLSWNLALPTLYPFSIFPVLKSRMS